MDTKKTSYNINVPENDVDLPMFDIPGACIYDDIPNDDGGYTKLCLTHNQPTKFDNSFGPNRACLHIEPYTPAELEMLNGSKTSGN